MLCYIQDIKRKRNVNCHIFKGKQEILIKILVKLRKFIDTNFYWSNVEMPHDHTRSKQQHIINRIITFYLKKKMMHDDCIPFSFSYQSATLDQESPNHDQQFIIKIKLHYKQMLLKYLKR